MITIIEGPDGAGKTTLVQDLRYRWINTVGHHQGPYVHDVIGETLTSISSAMCLASHVVCDRLHLGERIYGPVFRGKDMLGDLGQDILEESLLKVLGGVVQIICLPPYESHVKPAWLAREQVEMLDSTEQLERIYQLYKTQKSALPTIVYDWTRQTVDGLLDELVLIRSPGREALSVFYS